MMTAVSVCVAEVTRPAVTRLVNSYDLFRRKNAKPKWAQLKP